MLSEHACRHVLEEVERQVEHVLEGSGSDAQVDLVGGVQQQVVAQEIKTRIHGQGNGHAEPEYVQGGEGLVDQHLVDDDLEENRGHQGDGIDEQHRQGDIKEGHLLTKDLGDEPAQAERLVFVAEAPGAFEQEDLAGPDRLELLATQPQVFAAGTGKRVETGNQGFRLPLALCPDNGRDDQVAAVAQPGHGRAGLFQLDQFLPAEAQLPGLQPQVAGHTQQFDRFDLLVGQAVFVRQPVSGEFDLVFPGDDRKADQSGVDPFEIEDATGGGGEEFRQGDPLLTVALGSWFEQVETVRLAVPADVQPGDDQVTAVPQFRDHRQPGNECGQVGRFRLLDDGLQPLLAGGADDRLQCFLAAVRTGLFNQGIEAGDKTGHPELARQVAAAGEKACLAGGSRLFLLLCHAPSQKPCEPAGH